MSRTNFRNMKRMLMVFIVFGAIVFAVGSLGSVVRAEEGDGPTFDYDNVTAYVRNEYDSYIDEKTKYHNENYEGKTLYPQSLEKPIEAFNYYLDGTTVSFNNEYVVSKAIISNGYLFKEVNGVTNKTSYAEDLYTVIDFNSIDKENTGIPLDVIADKIAVIEQLNSDGTYTYYRENVELNNMQDVVYDEMLLQQDEGMVTWKINVPESGFYNLKLNYYPIEGNSSNIERNLAINGKTPFSGADKFTFSRIWEDNESSYEINEDGERVLKTDVKGNDMKPKQVENPHLMSSYFKDYMGYVNEPYMFYLEAGENFITLAAVKEPVLIDTISVLETTKYISYKEYLDSFGNITNVTGKSVRIEAENTSTKSSPTLYPATDRSSSKTYPYSYTVTKLNVIGGTNWQVLGDWITWEFTVPETGFYNISMRAKQNMVRGMYSSRKVYINDEILFDELNDVQFKYKNNWQMVTLGNKDEDFLFYFETGKTYTIKMEVTLGQYAPLIEDLQVCIDDLNRIYRQIIAYTTVTPKPGTDYQLLENFPTLREDLTRNRDELVRISDEINKISGGKSDKTGVIDNVVVQLNDFVKNNKSVENIPTRLSTFNSNISSLGTLLNTLRELPLQLDYIQVHTPDVKLARANENIFRKAVDAVVKFVLSFFLDYSSISATDPGVEVPEDEIVNIEVWMTLGRDQANVIRSLIDTSFSKEHPNIKVELKLTAGDVLLKATLAGIGPDVALNVDSTLPVNYALRNAVMDLSERIYEYEYEIETNKDGEYVLSANKLPKLSEKYYEDIHGNKVIQKGYILTEDLVAPKDSNLPTIADLQLFMNETYPTYFDVLRNEIRNSNPNASAEQVESILKSRLSSGVEITAGMTIPTYLYELYPSLFTVARNIDNSKIETKLVKDQEFLMLAQKTDFNFWENTESYQYAKNVYMESSLRQFQFNYEYDEENGNKKGYGTYALPEKQIFLMMFVRDDIMEELGLADMIPETWDDMIDLIAELQTSQLQFYLPVNSEGASALNPIFVSKLYQLSGQLYADDNKSTGLKSDAAMTAFEEWTEYYTLYSFPLAANFTNRFRSGEQPIGIAYYELYNTLSVFAPEVRRWSFHKIPGTERTLDVVDDNGNPTGETVTYVDHTATASGTGCVMMRQPNRVSNKEATKVMDASWEFMKWWSSAETQTSFGREMEGILGSAARHTTANVKALQQLAWKKSDLNILMQQWSEVHELPQIAGSYISGREVENAYRQVINNGFNPREILYEYAGKIDVEIDRKRTEFGLELD